VKLEYNAATLFAPGATVVQVDVLFKSVPLSVTLKISSSFGDVAEDAAYPVGNVCGPVTKLLEYTLNVVDWPLQIELAFVVTLSITGNEFVVTKIVSVVEQFVDASFAVTTYPYEPGVVGAKVTVVPVESLNAPAAPDNEDQLYE
jgi:hypothetical protein